MKRAWRLACALRCITSTLKEGSEGSGGCHCLWDAPYVHLIENQMTLQSEEGEIRKWLFLADRNTHPTQVPEEC